MSGVEDDFVSVGERSGSGPDPESFRLIDLAEVFTRHARRLLVTTGAVALAAAALSLILPKWYRSTATVFGPEEVTDSKRVLSTLKSLAIPGVRSTTSAQSPETFIAILDSRKLRERIIQRFDLLKAYRARGVENCLRLLEKRAVVKFENTGIIRISVEDRDRGRAAEIANAMVEELDKINVEVRIYKARRARQYLEAQVAETRARLGAAEDSLARFQAENLAVSIDEQAKAAVEAAAELEAKAIELRIRKGIMDAYASDENPEVREVARELFEVEGQIQTLERGIGDKLTFTRLPELARQLGGRLRDVKVGEMLLALLTEDYEEARLDEAKETPVVQVLDVAVPAEKRLRPRRTLMVLTAAAGAFLVSLVAAVLADRHRALGSALDKARWAAVLGAAGRWTRARAHRG